MTSKGKDHKAMLKTVEQWIKYFGCEFYDQEDNFVVQLRCKLCTKWGSRINDTKNFSTTWILPGLESVKNMQFKGTQTICHIWKQNKMKRRIRWALRFTWTVMLIKHILAEVLKTCFEDEKALRIKFNSAYYLAKH